MSHAKSVVKNENRLAALRFEDMCAGDSETQNRVLGLRIRHPVRFEDFSDRTGFSCRPVLLKQSMVKTSAQTIRYVYQRKQFLWGVV